MYFKGLIDNVKNLFSSVQNIVIIARNPDLPTPTASYAVKNDYDRFKS